MTKMADRIVDLPATGYLRQKQLLAIVPISPATLWRKVKYGQFPRPVKLSEGVTAWTAENVRSWMDCTNRRQCWSTGHPSMVTDLADVPETELTEQNAPQRSAPRAGQMRPSPPTRDKRRGSLPSISRRRHS